jgi:hypothetical protein
MPDTFHARINEYIKAQDPEMMYQIDYGPIWAKNRKMSVFKLLTSANNKENLRTIMGYYERTEDASEYVCAAEFYSLDDEGKLKIIMHQVDFCTNNKSIFIHGYKNTLVPLRIDAPEEDKEGRESLENWLYERRTSNGNNMFTRIYTVQNGTIELYTKAANHKEAVDWARLSTSEIAKEANDKSMEEIFMNPKDAYDKLAIQPDWKPHTLAKRIEQLVAPETTKYQSRRKVVAMSYDSENVTKADKQRNRGTKETRDTATNAWTTTTTSTTPQGPNAKDEPEEREQLQRKAERTSTKSPPKHKTNE